VRRLLFAVLLAAAPATAAQADPVDLSPYLGIVPHVGDYRTYENLFVPSGRRETVLSVDPWKIGWAVRWEVVPSGAPPSIVSEYILPRKALWTDHLELLPLPHVKLRAPLLSSLPRQLPTVSLPPKHGGGITRRSRVIGLEALETPAFSFPAVLRIDVESTLRSKVVVPHRSTFEWHEWYLAGVGRVAREAGGEYLVRARINDVSLP
jgi:hypothetical protein